MMGSRMPTDADAPSDAALMERIRAGDADAFAALVRRHQEPLLNFFRRMGAHTGEAEEMVQVTFLRLYGYRMRYAPRAKFTTFLYTLARHAWIDETRRRARRREKAMPAAHAVSSADDVRRIEARLDVEAALARLSERLRLVVVMSVYQGLSYPEIAQALEIPVGTVKSRMFLALRALREALSVRSDGGSARA